MSKLGKTIFDQRWPKTSDFNKITATWQEDATNLLITFVWEAFELLKQEVIEEINIANSNEELERSITQLLEARIHKVMSGDEPFYVQHEVFEFETRLAPPAQPPQYDIAFILNANPRIMWPLEAKVLRTDGAGADYIKDLKDEFLTCRYAPFSGGGGMIGYLLSGSPENVFQNIQKKVPCKLKEIPSFSNRSHRYSNHKRKVPNRKKYPKNFRCQHFIFEIKK